MRFSKWIYVCGVAAMVAAGCASSGDSGSTTTGAAGPATTAAGSKPAKKSEYKITMIAKSDDNPVFQSAKIGAEKAAEDLGKANGCKITIDWQTPPTEDAQVQADRIGQAVNNGADAILVSCSDATKDKGAIDDAVGKGVPVMTFDSDSPDSKRFAFYGADDHAVGVQVMDELEGISNKQPLKVAILAGGQGPNLAKRVQGVQDEAKKYSNITIVDVFHHKESPQDASAEVTKDDNARPEINAWAMVGGWPLFNKSLLSLDPGKYKIVSVDALPNELDYIDKGIAPVLLAQPVYDWGYKSVGFIVDKIVLGKNVESYNKMDLIKVTKDNLGDWARQLKAWGMNDVDPKYLALAPAKK